MKIAFSLSRDMPNLQMRMRALALTGKIEGKRARGRQRIKCLDNITEMTSMSTQDSMEIHVLRMELEEEEEVRKGLPCSIAFH